MAVDSRIAPLMALLAAAPASLGLAPDRIDESAMSGDTAGEASMNPAMPVDSIQCPLAGDPGAGDHVFGIEYGGMTRSYRLHVPSGYDSAVPAPLLVSLHGLSSSSSDHAADSATSELSDLEGFVVMYPEGFEASWNAGECCGAASVAGIDDTGFVLHAVRDVAARLCIDPSLVYVSGIANGGALAWKLSCEAPGFFAAHAAIDADTSVTGCTPPASSPVISLGLAAEASDFPYETSRASVEGDTGTADLAWQVWSFLSAHSLP